MTGTLWWVLGCFLQRYYRRLAFFGAAGLATIIYGLVGQSPRPELSHQYWPPIFAAITFIITRLLIRRLLGQLGSLLLRRIRS
ncbi:hypothetical protein [Thalassospira mesophila]|uniref:hypothetical protein n=1 Tax=Thalassospira mesophila TaxID=1293891 RepID=UPI000A201004|nr:hypothetical protein [Thalassospira mesophila]